VTGDKKEAFSPVARHPSPVTAFFGTFPRRGANQ
jgi:hypothetical protein